MISRMLIALLASKVLYILIISAVVQARWRPHTAQSDQPQVAATSQQETREPGLPDDLRHRRRITLPEPSHVELRPLPLWREVHVSGNPALRNAGITLLAKALPPTLESLWLCRTSCGDEAFCELIEMLKSTRIQQLGFDSNSVGNAGWHQLAVALEQDGKCHTAFCLVLQRD